MSLTRFIAMPDVKARVKPLRPKLPRRIAAPLQVEPRSDRHSLVGTAFDYLLRFELQRRAPHAVAGPWIAEHAPETIISSIIPLGKTGGYASWLTGSLGGSMHPEQEAECARRVLAPARAAHAAYLKSKAPSRKMRAGLAAHAIRLARLDSVFRASYLDPRVQEADPEDVQDLLDLLAVVPFNELLHETLLLLNPTFEDSGRLVGGADADVIAGNLLVDFKTTMKGETSARDLDQLLGYLLLARKQRQADPSFPAIERLGLYYSRHGYLRTMEARVWTEHPEFWEIESWFFNRAKEVYGRAKVIATTGSPL